MKVIEFKISACCNELIWLKNNKFIDSQQQQVYIKYKEFTFFWMLVVATGGAIELCLWNDSGKNLLLTFMNLI